jgi:hypothetical protein
VCPSFFIRFVFQICHRKYSHSDRSGERVGHKVRLIIRSPKKSYVKRILNYCLHSWMHCIVQPPLPPTYLFDWSLTFPKTWCKKLSNAFLNLFCLKISERNWYDNTCWNAHRNYPCGNKNVMRWRWRKNPAGRLHWRWGRHAAAHQVPVR